MTIYENFGFGKWREGVGTVRASGGDAGGGSEMLCVGRTRQRRGGVSPTMTGDHQNRVTDYTAIACFQNTGIGYWMEHKFAETLRTPCGGDSMKANLVVEKKRKYIVRRLTPLECCRLQGFPDWWEDGVEGSDSVRDKMWGNGIALPCAVDVLRRIAKEMEDTNGHQTD